MWLDLNSASALRPSGRRPRKVAERHRRAAARRCARSRHRRCRARRRRSASIPRPRSSAVSRSFSRRDAGGLAAHHRDARGKRAHAFVDAVGLPVHDLDAGIVDAERLGADLRHHRLDALADRGDAGNHLDGAVGATSMRTLSNGPRPLFSTNMAKPAPTDSPSARRARASRCMRRPVGRASEPCRAAARSRRSCRRCRCRACRTRL